MFSNGVVIVCCLLFYFATLDSNAFGVEGEEDFEVFEEDQGKVATQRKPYFDLMPLSYCIFFALLHSLSIALTLC
jgi:hypothetical protein